MGVVVEGVLGGTSILRSGICFTRLISGLWGCQRRRFRVGILLMGISLPGGVCWVVERVLGGHIDPEVWCLLHRAHLMAMGLLGEEIEGRDTFWGV